MSFILFTVMMVLLLMVSIKRKMTNVFRVIQENHRYYKTVTG
jgi:hypothetical protein